MRFVLFTKSRWAEPPRLRHQVANMLVIRGHEVIFFEKNGFLVGSPSSERDGVHLRRHGELLHHQLRATHGIARMNWAYERSRIRKLIPLDGDPVIINFNYDYFGLRDLFPGQPLVTMINDDFIGPARPYSRRETRRALRLTAQASDEVLAVSYPLLDQLDSLGTPGQLFLPWARHPYRRPVSSSSRGAMLLWGSISEFHVDLPVVEGILDLGIPIHFAGPVMYSPGISRMFAHPGATYHGIAPLEELQDVLDQCACSIVPYRIDDHIATVTISNRSFEILSTGLPLLYSDIPSLLEAPGDAIRRCRGVEGFRRGFLEAKENFEAAQPHIQTFLQDHTEDRRYEQLMGLVEGAGTDNDMGQ